MEISREAATAKGPAEFFTGDVWVDPITRGLAPAPLNVAAVTRSSNWTPAMSSSLPTGRSTGTALRPTRS
jgi:hypothetical protein